VHASKFDEVNVASSLISVYQNLEKINFKKD